MSKGIDSKEGQAGSVLERGEGLVESEPLRESLGALGTESVVLETAKEQRWAMSKGPDRKNGDDAGCERCVVHTRAAGASSW